METEKLQWVTNAAHSGIATHTYSVLCHIVSNMSNASFHTSSVGQSMPCHPCRSPVHSPNFAKLHRRLVWHLRQLKRQIWGFKGAGTVKIDFWCLNTGNMSGRNVPGVAHGEVNTNGTAHKSQFKTVTYHPVSIIMPQCHQLLRLSQKKRPMHYAPTGSFFLYYSMATL